MSSHTVHSAKALVPQPESIRRILACQLRQIGDVLLSTPSLELLARHFPQAEIHFFTEKKCLPMVQNNPHIHTLWGVDKKNLPTLIHELIFYRKVTRGGFDLVADFQQLPRCRWVVAFSGAPIRLSFPPPWYLRPLYTHWTLPAPAYAGAYKAGVLKPLGITWNGERPRLYLTDDERRKADALLYTLGVTAEHRLITVDPTHRHATRRWPAPHFAKLMDMAIEQDSRVHFLLSYGPGEEDDVRALRELCSQKAHIHVPPALLSLRDMAACIERAILHLGNCSAPRHMAVAVGTPTVTILGSTSSGWTFPAPEHIHIHSSLPCQPCNKNSCSDAIRCLAELQPETVFPAFTRHLAAFGERPQLLRP